MNSLSVDSEFRYIVQWFLEWSELQRDDFAPILVECLQHGSSNGVAHVNGVVNSVANATITDKPMSLFQCRIKLFREWTPKWPAELKHKLKEKIIELDPKVGEQIMHEFEGTNDAAINTNGSEANVNGGAFDDDNTTAATAATAAMAATATDIVGATEEASNADNRLSTHSNDETTTVDTDANNASGDTIDADTVAAAAAAVAVAVAVTIEVASAPMEPAEQVQMQTEENVATTTTIAAAPTVVSNAEMPLVA